MYDLIVYFFVYGFLGWCTEVAFAACKERKFVNRGFLNGPICPIYGFGVSIVLRFLSSYKENLLILYISSIVLVTALEWLTGFILEKIFHNKWWDYSDMPLNLNGYVCLVFSLIWGAACVLIVDFIHPLIQKGFTFLPYWLGVILLVVLSIAMFADLYVTASTILKMNKRLEKMEEIAAELRRISDELGENIYRDTIRVMEHQEELKEKVQDASEELKERMQDTSEEWKDMMQDVSEEWEEKRQEMSERIAALRKRYRELGSKGTKTSRRLLRAFPKLESKKYREAMEDWKKNLKRK